MINSSHHAALKLLESIIAQGKNLDNALNSRIFTDMELRDKKFVRQILMVTLRHWGIIDKILENFMERPLPKKDIRTQLLLSLGTAHLLWMGTPDYAAVNSMVELAKQTGAHRHTGLINAVLKAVANGGDELLYTLDKEILSLPEWLWKRWVKQYGEDTTREIIRAQMQIPPLDLSPKESIAQLKALLPEGEILPQGSLRLHEAGMVNNLAGFNEGQWWVQDAAAAIPALLFGEVKGKHIYDLCAAPGGKTAQLAAKGAQVTAVDLSESRIKRLKENLARLELSAQCICADLDKWQAPAVDAVLLDAPCSATGTLRRHPDLAWKKTAPDIKELAEIQSNLLKRAALWVKSGGILIYATCSLEPEEGEMQIEKFLKNQPEFKLVPIEAQEVGDASFIKDGMLRTLPCFLAEKGGMDGFFAARMIRS